jgi:hypothetical protein
MGARGHGIWWPCVLEIEDEDAYTNVADFVFVFVGSSVC